MENQPAPPNKPPYKLFSIGQIGLAAFLGTPLPGMWMLSANFKRLGQKSKATNMLLAGVGLTALNIVLALVLPDSVPPMSVSLPFFIVVWQLARMQLAKPLSEHAANGGQIDSWGKAIAYGVAGLVVFIALIIGVIMVLPE